MVKGPDGVDMMEAPVSVAELRNRVKSKYDYFNYKEAIDKRVNSLPKKQKIKTLYDKYGKMIFEVEDFTQFEDFDKFLELEANSMMENQFNISSLLTDDLIETEEVKDKEGNVIEPSKEYFYVVEETDGQGNVIGYKNAANGESVGNIRGEDMIIIRTNPDSGVRELDFTDTQKDRVREALKREVQAQLPFKQIFKQQVRPEKPTPTELQQLKGEEAADKAVNLIGQLYYGTDKEIEAALDYFRDSIGADKVTRTNKGIIVTTIDKDGNVTDTPINFRTSTGELKSQQEFIESAGPLLAGEADISGALKRGKYKKDAPFRGDIFGADDKEVSFESGREVAKPEQPIDRARVYVREKVSADDFTNKNSKDTGREYEALYGPLGFTFEYDGWGNDMTITGPDETTITINTNENRAEAAKTAERVASWLASKITNENADIADQANLFGTKDKEEAQAAAGNKAPRE